MIRRGILDFVTLKLKNQKQIKHNLSSSSSSFCWSAQRPGQASLSLHLRAKAVIFISSTSTSFIQFSLRVVFIIKMVMLTAASTIANSPLLQAGSVGRCRGRAGHYGSGPRRVCLDRSVVQYDMRPVGLGARFSLERRKPIAPVTGSSRMQSASVICASALNARCGAEQTQTVTREAPTITHLPGKEKSPLLDDGGSGFPPRDDGGGGGGGGNWSGGFAFFGFLLFLSFLKDKESEGSYRENRKR